MGQEVEEISTKAVKVNEYKKKKKSNVKYGKLHKCKEMNM